MSTQVKLSTSSGDIVVELDEEKAPATVSNFLEYVNDGFYNGTVQFDDHIVRSVGADCFFETEIDIEPGPADVHRQGRVMPG